MQFIFNTRTIPSFSEEIRLFFTFCKDGNTVALLHLLEIEPDFPINHQNASGETGLFAACERGEKKVVELLLMQPSLDVNLPRKDGNTPLSIAVLNGHKEIVQLLLTSLATDLFKSGPEGHTAFDIAVRKGQKDLVLDFIRFIGIRYDLPISLRDFTTRLKLHYFPQLDFDYPNGVHDCQVKAHPEGKVDITQLEINNIKRSIEKELYRIKGARLFALTLAVSTQFLTIDENNSLDEQKTRNIRFFRIMKRLPKELHLEMVRVLTDYYLPSRLILPVWRELARKIQSKDSSLLEKPQENLKNSPIPSSSFLSHFF